MRPFRVDPWLLDFARGMRHNAVSSEQKLWRCLRDRQLNGHKFRRQVPMDKYVADFYCVASRLVVELDGDSHEERQEYDAQRTLALSRGGLSVVRFTNDDVQSNLENVLLAILEECENRSHSNIGPSPRPSPLKYRGEGEI